MPMMGLLHFSPALGLGRSQKCGVHYEYSVREKVKLQTMKLSALASPCMQQQDIRNTHRVFSTRRPICILPYRRSAVKCRASLLPVQKIADSCIKGASETLRRSYGSLQGNPFAIKLISAVGVIVFALWGLGPLVRSSRKFFQKSNSSWRQSTSHYVLTSYLQPVFLWIGAMLVCRALDPIVMPSEASNLVKQRLLTFVRSLSTVLAFAYGLSSAIQQFQNFLVETSGQSNARNMGFQFAGKAVHTAVWVAAVSLFMELLGFSTQKWLTAGGLGTVMITLAGREIFTNFLSSVMIHATRPFIVNDWIQTKIEGYEVSGFVEHVGWWSPTVIRGEDREAVHIPNHKFTVNVVRNLTQKTHWRIKTHLAISHLDVNKINKIVADMRKVLAKNPQVEQQRLHRRVFLENVDPENQALLILISCFVKTSHHEEYLCVKEAVLLDLLRVISHHGARLATPIRTIHRVYRDADLESAPESSFSRGSGAAINRPFLLIEPSNKISGEDRATASPQSVQSGKVQDSLATARQASSDLKSNAKTREASVSTLAKETLNSAVKVEPGNMDKEEMTLASTPELEEKQTVKSSLTDISVEESKVADSMANISGEHSKHEPGLQDSQQTSKIENPACSSESSMESLNGSSSSRPQPKQDEKSSAAQPSKQRPTLEDNIVLGVALEGSKRTLPIDEAHQGSDPTLAEMEEVVAKNNNVGGNGNRTGIGKPGVEKDEKDN